MEVTAHINIDTPAGRKLVREIEKHKNIAEVIYPSPEEIAGQKTYTIEESYDECCQILSEHYGVNFKSL
ncbi:MAG TPA: hypothetical protein P5084_05090 [Paludibacter sp.]|nr:hypothetical protein [Paludibacter sp.]